jgi:hypothetical protein
MGFGRYYTYIILGGLLALTTNIIAPTKKVPVS